MGFPVVAGRRPSDPEPGLRELVFQAVAQARQAVEQVYRVVALEYQDVELQVEVAQHIPEELGKPEPGGVLVSQLRVAERAAALDFAGERTGSNGHQAEHRAMAVSAHQIATAHPPEVQAKRPVGAPLPAPAVWPRSASAPAEPDDGLLAEVRVQLADEAHFLRDDWERPVANRGNPLSGKAVQEVCGGQFAEHSTDPVGDLFEAQQEDTVLPQPVALERVGNMLRLAYPRVQLALHPVQRVGFELLAERSFPLGQDTRFQEFHRTPVR